MMASTNCHLAHNSKLESIKASIRQTVSEKSRRKIASIVHEVEQLSDVEKLFLYLQLPSGPSTQDATDTSKLRGPGNSFGKKAELEVAQTYTWIQSHLEEDPTVSLQKQEVYDEYRRFCQSSKFEPLCVADFGKAMKHVFPKVKPRRLGQRGNSKYCYSGLKMKFLVDPPTLPLLDASDEIKSDGERRPSEYEKPPGYVDLGDTDGVILSWAGKQLDSHFMTMQELSSYLSCINGSNHSKNSASFAKEGETCTLSTGTSMGTLRSRNASGASNQTTSLINGDCQKEGAAMQEATGVASSGVRNKQLHQVNEKEQKKKQLEQSKLFGKASNYTTANITKNKKGRKLSGNSCKSFSSNLLLIKSKEPEVVIKAEPLDFGHDESSTTRTVPSMSLHQATANRPELQNKIPVSRTGTSTPCHVSPASSISSIIVLPSLPQVRLTPQPASMVIEASPVYSGHSNSAAAGASPLSSQKYKKIQPKPDAINRSCSAIEPFFSSQLLDDASLRRRHSVSVPFVVDGNSLRTADVLLEKQHHSQVKRHIDEKEATAAVMSKKRLVDSTPDLANLGPLRPSMSANYGNGGSGDFDLTLSQLNAPSSLTHNTSSNNSNSNIAVELDNGSSSGTSLSPVNLQLDNNVSVVNSMSNPLVGGGSSSDAYGTRIVQELENSALLEYLNDNSQMQPESWESSSQTAKLSQLRKLLERNLPQPGKGQMSTESPPLQGFNELRQAIQRNNVCLSETNEQLSTHISPLESMSVSVAETSQTFDACREPEESPFECLVSTPLGFPEQHQQDLQQQQLQSASFTDACDPFPSSLHACTDSSGVAQNLTFFNVQTQVPSVPASPNTRRRAFNFQPISPRSTPTIPENTQLAVFPNEVDVSLQQQHCSNRQSIGVGPSQPTSATNSPFMSPRSTPVPLTRSRHNSGQSCYSASQRQTPYQNFDSGVSSISGSPFISPQSTPVPLMGRARNGSGPLQRGILLNARARHSSGPGGPYSSAAALFTVSRSTSLSPMTSGSLYTEGCFSTGNVPSISALAADDRQGQHFLYSATTQQQQKQVTGSVSSSTVGTPISPLSEPLSPSGVLAYSDQQQLTQHFHQQASEINQPNSEVSLQQQPIGDWRFRINPTRNLARHRHVSSPYILNQQHPSGESFLHHQPRKFMSAEEKTSNFVQHLSNGGKCIGNGGGLPVSKLVTANNFTTSSDNGGSNGNGQHQQIAASWQLGTLSRSYPATPICNQSFSFPSSPPTSKIASMQGDVSSSVSGQDVMIGSQITRMGNWREQSAAASVRPEECGSGANGAGAVRRNLTDLLTTAPVEDDLQTTLEDLRDCDNDFSKFAQELEAMEATGEGGGEELP